MEATYKCKASDHFPLEFKGYGRKPSCFQDFETDLVKEVSYNETLNKSQAVSEGLPQLNDIKSWVVLAVVFIVLRRIAERCVLQKIAAFLEVGVRSRNVQSYSQIPCRSQSAIPLLESVFQENSQKGRMNLSPVQEKKLKCETKLDSKEIQRWFRRRRQIDGSVKQKKFAESGWKFITYLGANVFAIYVIWGKEWIWNENKCWENFPNQTVTDDIRWYYAYQGGMYLSFLFQYSSEVKRKDYWEMLVHHVVTLILLVVSWNYNFIRASILNLVVLDCSDIFLEPAKLAKYAKKMTVSTGFFCIFLVVWMVSRLYVHPFIIHLRYNFKGAEFVPLSVSIPTLSLASVFVWLNLFWTYHVIKTALSVTRSLNDSRSSDEDTSEMESEAEIKN